MKAVGKAAMPTVHARNMRRDNKQGGNMRAPNEGEGNERGSGGGGGWGGRENEEEDEGEEAGECGGGWRGKNYGE